MPAHKPKRPAPLSLRLTFQERAKLELWADKAGMSLSAYMKWCVFERDNPMPKTRMKHPTKDHKSLAKLLALLGASRIASNINQLAKAVHSGSLPVNADTETAITRACAAIEDMRFMLIRALGFKS